MKFTMNSFEPLLIDVGVNLGGRNIGVAEHLLNDPKICAVAQQMGGETVPQQVRINILFQTGVLRFFLHNLPDPHRR